MSTGTGAPIKQHEVCSEGRIPSRCKPHYYCARTYINECISATPSKLDRVDLPEHLEDNRCGGRIITASTNTGLGGSRLTVEFCPCTA